MLPELLLSEKDVFECPACDYQYKLWAAIIQKTKSIEYGERAFRGWQLEQLIEDGVVTPDEMDAADWEDMLVVRAESKRYEAAQTFEREQELKNKAKK